VAHMCQPSYFRGWSEEDHVSRSPHRSGMVPCITSLTYIQIPLKGAKDKNQSCSYWPWYSKSFRNSMPDLWWRGNTVFKNISLNKIASQVNKSFLWAGDPKGLWLSHGLVQASSIVTNYLWLDKSYEWKCKKLKTDPNKADLVTLVV
jgi:hypothetical protein